MRPERIALFLLVEYKMHFIMVHLLSVCSRDLRRLFRSSTSSLAYRSTFEGTCVPYSWSPLVALGLLRFLEVFPLPPPTPTAAAVAAHSDSDEDYASNDDAVPGPAASARAAAAVVDGALLPTYSMHQA